MTPRALRVRVRIIGRRIRRLVLIHVLHANDPPHRLALGAAIGVFVTFTPTIGLQMSLVVFLAWLLRANKVIGVPVVWLTNPATIVPIYYPCYAIGRFLLHEPEIGMAWWQQLQHPPHGWWPSIQFYYSRMMEVFIPLWLGCLIVSTFAAILTYYFVYYGVCWYRMRRWGQLMPPAATHPSR